MLLEKPRRNIDKLLSVTESTNRIDADDFLSFNDCNCHLLTFDLLFHPTLGSNFNLTNKDYTHGMVIRFRSREFSFL